MARYLITGGAGFIGSNITERLVEKGEKVKVLDNLSTGCYENIENFISEIEFIYGDIRDFETLKEAINNVDFVIHQAAISSVPYSIKSPKLVNDVNIGGTLNILLASKNENVKRVVNASSSAVYGDSDELPKNEDMLPNPKSPYAISKYVGELYSKNFYEVYGLETISLRYFNVFGPKQDPNSEYAAVVPIFIKKLLFDTIPTIYGDGEQSRDFIFVSDVVDANIKACKTEDTKGEVLNIGNGKETTLNQLFEILQKVFNKNNISAFYSNPRKGDVRHSLANIELAKDVINFKPEYTIKQGLLETIEWYKK